MPQPVTFKPGEKIRLADFDPNAKGSAKNGHDKEAALAETAANVAVIDDLSYKLYAENRRAVLLVLQGMDASGKDGVIRKVMEGIDPQTCQVTAFKRPSEEELDRDFLWRVHKAAPRRGTIGIFNRSHYEDVLVVRVHNLVPAKEWRGRYDRINDFERMLVEGGTTLVKVFLHIGQEEQKQRLQERLDDPKKRWKFALGDLAERKLWDAYQEAYEDALNRCNTEYAPWHIVPANSRSRRNLLVSRLLRETLERLDPKFPPADPSLDGIKVE
jgi:PPK2 family polyphosphate:nucleotide phosphotransferase